MAHEPLPPVKTVEDAMRSASEQLRALKKTKPQNAIEARIHSSELVRLQQELISATHRATDAAAAKRLNGSNGAAKPPAEVVATDLHPDLLMAMVEGIAQYYNPLLRAIEKDIAELKSRPLLEDGGVWSELREYRKGCVVTDGGNLWVAKQDNSNSRPPNDAWRLMNRTKAHR